MMMASYQCHSGINQKKEMIGMSAKIMVSYTEDSELQGILKILEPVTLKHKIAKDKKGRFYNAYIEVKTHETLVNTSFL